MLVAKPTLGWIALSVLFENYVNYAGSKTLKNIGNQDNAFENYVNYAGSKTLPLDFKSIAQFENYVNYAGSKTTTCYDWNR